MTLTSRSQDTASQAALDRLTRLHPKIIDLSLGRIERLLDRLGNPHHKLPPVIHLAGTNGKGSTTAFLRAMLEASGYDVHAYTSPHLVDFHERIRLAGTIIGEAQLTEILEECETANGDAPITFFEITTAVAFLAFSRTPADVVLLETGLGGRLDATNLIDQPALTIVTPVSLDHQSYLGDTLTKIASEKAGILKPGVPCVVATQDPDAQAAIERIAKVRGATLLCEGDDWRLIKTPEGFTYRSSSGTITLPKPNLVGAHQVHNAGLAVAALDALRHRFAVPDEAFDKGLRNAQWPARLQRLSEGPLADKLGRRQELWLDGGHNPAAARVVAAQMDRWKPKATVLIFGALNTRDPKEFLTPLADRVTGLYAVDVPGEANSLSAQSGAAAARDLGLDANTAPDVETAIERALAAAEGAPLRIVICGSLYLAGTVLRSNQT